MRWTEKLQEQPRRQSVLESGAVRLSVRRTNSDENCQHFLLWFCEFSVGWFEDSMRDWPRQAIATAREKLDEFEAKLNAQSQANE